MTSVEENWDGLTISDLDAQLDNSEFENKIKTISDRILNIINRFNTENCITDIENFTLTQDNDYDVIVERNEQLRQEIDAKLKEVSEYQTQYETLKQDQKLLTQELKDTHEAFLMANKFYRKYLNMYYTINNVNEDKQIIHIQFFTESKKENDIYSVHLSRDPNARTFELLETNPQFSNIKELQEMLQETNDVPGLLCCIRKAFLEIKEKKHAKNCE